MKSILHIAYSVFSILVVMPVTFSNAASSSAEISVGIRIVSPQEAAQLEKFKKHHKPSRTYTYEGGKPYSNEWYRWCGMRYRSFDKSSGKYTDKHGRKKDCVMPQSERERWSR